MNVIAFMSPGHGESFSEDRLVVFDTVLSQGRFALELPQERDGVLAILDGVGGVAGSSYASGFIASSLALNGAGMTESTLPQLLLEDDLYLRENARGATTVSGLLLRGGDTFLFHIGNTRVYAEEDGYLTQLTVDQTLVYEYGYIPNTAEYAANKHIITGCLGGSSGTAKDKLRIKRLDLPRKGCWLLTCDGIHEHVEIYDLEALALREMHPEKMIDMARRDGSEDDCSFMLIQW